MEGRIKTLGEVKREMRKQNVEVIATKDFVAAMKRDPLAQVGRYSAGYGLYHDGYNETLMLVQLKLQYLERMQDKYPYICWH